jgi:hypothetical protein
MIYSLPEDEGRELAREVDHFQFEMTPIREPGTRIFGEPREWPIQMPEDNVNSTTFDRFILEMFEHPELFASADTEFSYNFGTDERTGLRRALDTDLTFIIYYALKNRTDLTIALQQQNEQGGPYLNVTHGGDSMIIASIVSNYDRVEMKEKWYQAALSLIHWHSITTAYPYKTIFRKSWIGLSDKSLIDVAAAIALPIVYFFDAARFGEVVVRHSLPIRPGDVDSMMGRFLAFRPSWPIPDNPKGDTTVAHYVLKESLAAQEIPGFAETDPTQELTLALGNVEDAQFMAEDAGDEIGMISLPELVSRLDQRMVYEKQMKQDIVSLLTAEDRGFLWQAQQEIELVVRNILGIAAADRKPIFIEAPGGEPGEDGSRGRAFTDVGDLGDLPVRDAGQIGELVPFADEDDDFPVGLWCVPIPGGWRLEKQDHDGRTPILHTMFQAILDKDLRPKKALKELTESLVAPASLALAYNDYEIEWPVAAYTINADGTLNKLKGWMPPEWRDLWPEL